MQVSSSKRILYVIGLITVAATGMGFYLADRTHSVIQYFRKPQHNAAKHCHRAGGRLNLRVLIRSFLSTKLRMRLLLLVSCVDIGKDRKAVGPMAGRTLR